MPIATNPDTGDVVFLDADGQWKPAQKAVNPQTNEMLAFDGKEWKPVPASKGVFKYIDDVVRSLASGITFGFADELAAKADELIGRGTYEQNVARERARDESIPAAIAVPGEIAGAVAGTLAAAPIAAGAAGARAVQAASKLPQTLKFAGLGGAEGALAGAGHAKEGGRASGAATGAGVGAVVGAAAPHVVRGVSGAVNAVRGAVSPQANVAADLSRAVLRDTDTPEALAGRAAAISTERPGVGTIADVGGENVRGLVERVAQTPGAGRTQVIPFLTKRQGEQFSRIADDLSTLTGTRRSAHQATEEVIAERATAATPLYQAAYEAGDVAVWSPTLERLSASPTVRDAMQGAVRVWRDNAIADGFGAMNPGAMVERGGQLTFLQGKVPVFPNIQFWDYTKRIIDDQVGAAVRAGEDQKARTLTRLAQALRNELDSVVPEYRAAREAWAGPSAYLNAIEEGRNILSKSMSSEEFTAAFRALSPSEREGFRIGAVSSIISRMGNDPAKLADFTKYLRSNEARAKIAALMPTPEAAQQWARRLEFEIGSSELTGKALGNSATARRLAEKQDAEGLVGDLVLDAISQAPTSLVRRALLSGPRWLRDTLRSRADAQLADILTNPDRAQDLMNVIQSGGQVRARHGPLRVRVTPAERTNAAVTAGGVALSVP